MRYRPSDFLILAALACTWGLAFLFIDLGLRSFSPLLMGALRLDLIALTMFVVQLARHRSIPLPRGANQWQIVLLAAVLSVGAYNAFLNWGQQFTTPGIAGVLIGLNPILTAVIGHALIPEERVRLRHVAGLVVGFAGVLLLAALKGGSPFDIKGRAELAVAIAIGCWALGSVLVKKSNHGMPVDAFIAWHCLFGGLLLHGAALAVEGGGRARFDTNGIVSMAFLVLGTGAAGFFLFYRLMDRVGPLRANIVSYFTPIVANLSGLVVLHQSIEPRAYFAFVLLVAGFVLVAYHEERPIAPSPAEPGAVHPVTRQENS
jgi:drug/metabolite transporter (DMT)-like permease